MDMHIFIILKWIENKENGRAWARFLWLRIGATDRLLWTSNELLRSTMREISWLAKQLRTSQGNLCSVKFQRVAVAWTTLNCLRYRFLYQWRQALCRCWLLISETETLNQYAEIIISHQIPTLHKQSGNNGPHNWHVFKDGVSVSFC
jgi:hypothetical protein